MSRTQGLGLAIGVVLVVALGVLAFGEPSTRSDDVARRRDLDELLPLYPGAVLIDEQEYELTGPGDDGPSGNFSLTRVYRLPGDVQSAQVVAFYADHVPARWGLLGDSYCSPEPGARLLAARSRINLFTEPWTFGDPLPAGVGISLDVRSGQKLMTVGETDASCGGPADEADPQADAFDAFSS